MILTTDNRTSLCGEYCPICATELVLVKPTSHKWCPNGTGGYGCDWETTGKDDKTLNKKEANELLISLKLSHINDVRKTLSRLEDQLVELTKELEAMQESHHS